MENQKKTINNVNRILLSQDNGLLAEFTLDLSRYQAAFTPVLEAYNKLEIGILTDDVFEQIITGNFNDIATRYKESLNEHLENTLVKNSTLKRIVLEGSEEMIAGFLQACKDFLNTELKPISYKYRDRSAFLNPKDLSQKKGDLQISPESTENLLEKHCRIYVEGEQEHLVYNALLKMQSGLQEFRNMLFELGMPMSLYDMDGGQGYMVNHYVTDFFRCMADKKVTIKPSSIKWVSAYVASLK